MKKIVLPALIAVLFTLPLSSQAFAPKKGDKSCIECHKLDKKDAEVIVKKAIATATVLDVKLSPVKGVWEIDVETSDGKRGPLYLDFAKKYLIAGQFIPVEALGPPPNVDVSKIPLEHAIIVGAKNAAHKVIVFSDPDCPYCQKLHVAIKEVVAKRADIAFAIILNPLPMHKDAFKKAQAVQCAMSTDMLDDAFSGKAVPEPACPPDQIEKNKALAQSLKFSGTPALVRSDGAVQAGYLPSDKLIEWIDKKQ